MLLKTSSSNPHDPSRVIITSSAGHSMAPKGGVDYNSVKRKPRMQQNGTTSNSSSDGVSSGSKDHLDPGANELMTWIEYGQSKWGNIACAKWLDRVYGPRSIQTGNKETERIAEGEIISIALHPGEYMFWLSQYPADHLDRLRCNWSGKTSSRYIIHTQVVFMACRMSISQFAFSSLLN